MADQKRKSQAEKAASSKFTLSKSVKKPAVSKDKDKKSPVKSASDSNSHQIPPRLISSAVFIALFIIFLVAFLNPDGELIRLFANFIYGLIGKTGFIIAIPVLLYLFFIHAFSGKRPVRMRTFCLIAFVLLCGCIAHRILAPENLPKGLSVVRELYLGGIADETGGLICGCISMLIAFLCGNIITYIILFIAALLTLLGGMQITIPSIIRAVQNRPKSDLELELEKEKEFKQEPAAVVVNHIANKRIEYIEKKRNQTSSNSDSIPGSVGEAAGKASKSKNRANDIMRQIDGDVEVPVAAAGDAPCSYEGPISNPSEPIKKQENTHNAASMPALELDTIRDPQPEAAIVDPEIAQSVKKDTVTAKDAEKSAAEVAQEIAKATTITKPPYCFPPVDLLKQSGRGVADGTAEMRENSQRLTETLASFKIEAHIINVTRGPSVTRYEVELEKGVRLNKLTTAADDIALSLGATGVRIAAVPGKISVVGIEVPNRAVTTVSLREVIESNEFTRAKSKSSFAVGKDIGGSSIVGNIARLPHMLIAGTTGSGKSVCMNSIIISLLYKASPDDVKLIMVDPKMVELGIYNGIPHLLIPVVTDPKKAAGSLQWAVSEMMRRYKAMSDAGVRDLETFNSIIDSQEVEVSKMPQIVVIIDELADLMLVAAKEVEESICRIAQMGRAAGIHLVIATQRPSADVITGLMKANIPSRIAFAVASAMESRIILDTQGAEKLVGKGDMLYAPIGDGKPKRVQGCFVSDSEVEAVASYVKANYATTYDEQVMQEIDKKAAQTGNNKTSASDPEPTSDELDGDEMLPAAVDVILETGQASVSMLQRRLKLGYARAARIVDEMEEKGIVGPFVGSKPRAILITKEQWASMRSGDASQLGFDDMEADGGPTELENE